MVALESGGRNRERVNQTGLRRAFFDGAFALSVCTGRRLLLVYFLSRSRQPPFRSRFRSELTHRSLLSLTFVNRCWSFRWRLNPQTKKSKRTTRWSSSSTPERRRSKSKRLWTECTTSSVRRWTRWFVRTAKRRRTFAWLRTTTLWTLRTRLASSNQRVIF